MQPALFRWAGGDAEAGATAKISAFVTQIWIAAGFQAAVLFSVFPFFNELPPPPPQEQDEQESLHTNPLWYGAALAQTESTF